MRGFRRREYYGFSRRFGGIKVADFHGNLFVNQGGGKAAEVIKMAEVLKNRVKRKFGICLEEEVSLGVRARN